MTSPPPDAASDRRVLVIAHTGRADAREVAREFCRGLTKNGMTLRLLEDEATELDLDLPDVDVDVVAPSADAAAECERRRSSAPVSPRRRASSWASNTSRSSVAAW